MTVTRKLARPLPAASAAGCEEVLSEDLQHGQSFGRVRVANPLRD